jgi:hypothetical protein
MGPTAGPQVHANCSYVSKKACLNGDLYNVQNICEDAICMIRSPVLDVNSSPTCDYCKECNFNAVKEGSPLTDVTYDIKFSGESVFLEDSTGNVIGYAVPPNSVMSLTDISDILYYCTNGAKGGRTSNLIVWVYNAIDNKKLAVGHNVIDIGNALNRSDVIGETSSATCGTPILNAWDVLGGFNNVVEVPGWDAPKISSIHNYTKPSNYTVFIDLVSGYCGYNHITRELTQNYVCPWLGETNRSNYCHDKFNQSIDGWMPKENFTVLVPGPDITITAPASETNLAVTKIQKKWAIRNTGLGRITMNITYDCGNWTCAFDGYNGNPIPLEENEEYTPGITLNITIDPAKVNHQVGIIVTYDEGYGLKSIPPQTKTSYIEFGVSYTT